MYFKIKKFTLAYIVLSVASLVWMSQFHPFAILSGLFTLIALFTREKLQLGNRALGAVILVGLLLCFFCTRTLSPQNTGLFLGIGTMSLALLASWLLTFSLLLKKSGYLVRAPLILASSVIILCSMSIDFQSVIAIAALSVLFLVAALREALKLRTSVRHLAPLLVTLVLMSGLAMTARWSESKLSFLMGLFSLMPPAGIDFPSTTSLNSLQRWNNSDIVALRGYGDDPPVYLVGRTFSEFDDKSFWRWKTTKAEIAPVDQVLLDTKNGPRAISLFQRSTQAPAEPGPAFKVEYPRGGNGLTFYLPRQHFAFAADVTRLHHFSDGMIQVLAMDQFNGEYFIFPFTEGWNSKSVAEPLSETERQDYLALPENLTKEVSRLAQEIAGSVEDPERKADFITSYLQQNFTYGYDFPFESSQTALEEFLIKRPPVHCEFFATAAALMLRTQGVPTRYINGFVMQEKAIGGEYYVVRIKHAHAWIEAYIPNKGWVTFDPTPPGTLGDPDDSAALKDAIVEWLSNAWRRFFNFFSLSPTEMLQEIKAFFTRLTVFDYVKFGLLLGLCWLWSRYKAWRLRRPSKKSKLDLYAPGRDQKLTPTLEAVVEQVQPKSWQRKASETPRQWLERLRMSDLDQKTLEQFEHFLAQYTELRFSANASDSGVQGLEQSREKLQDLLKGKTLQARSSEKTRPSNLNT